MEIISYAYIEQYICYWGNCFTFYKGAFLIRLHSSLWALKKKRLFKKGRVIKIFFYVWCNIWKMELLPFLKQTIHLYIKWLRNYLVKFKTIQSSNKWILIFFLQMIKLFCHFIQPFYWRKVFWTSSRNDLLGQYRQIHPVLIVLYFNVSLIHFSVKIFRDIYNFKS